MALSALPSPVPETNPEDEWSAEVQCDGEVGARSGGRAAAPRQAAALRAEACAMPELIELPPEMLTLVAHAVATLAPGHAGCALSRLSAASKS